MLTSFLLSLREGVEAALIIGIVLSALRQLGRADCARIVWSAIGSALALSGLAALALHWLGWTLEGPAEPIFEGTTLFASAGLLTWMVFWMKRQSRSLAAGLTAEVREAACASDWRGVFALTFVAVAREGLELALFLTAVSLDSKGTQIAAGAITGLAGAAVLGWLWFSSTARLNLRHFFQVTGAVMIFFAAGLIAKGVHEFNELGWIPAGADPLWNTRAILAEDSPLGSMLRTLFGYNSAPSLTVVIGYISYLGVVITVLGLAARWRDAKTHRRPTVSERTVEDAQAVR